MPRCCPYLLPLKYEVHLRRLFSLGSREMDSTAKCFGVVADIQHADVDDGTDFSGKQRRYYRNSLEVVKAATLKWREEKVKFIAQLGDLVDSKAKHNETSRVDCDRVMEELKKANSEYLVNIIGNHELYNFKRKELETLLGVVQDNRTWYSFKPWTDCGLRIVVLDSYDISTIEGVRVGDSKTALDLLSKHNPNDVTKFGVEWSLGLEGVERRFMPYNGMVSEEQLAWLEERLTKSAEEQETVIVLCHVPLHPQAANNLCLLWNYQSVLEVLTRSGCVVAVLAGHDHDGGYHHEDGLHHFTLSSPLLCSEGELAFGTITATEDALIWKWFGEHHTIPSSLKIDFCHKN